MKNILFACLAGAMLAGCNIHTKAHLNLPVHQTLSTAFTLHGNENFQEIDVVSCIITDSVMLQPYVVCTVRFEDQTMHSNTIDEPDNIVNFQAVRLSALNFSISKRDVGFTVAADSNDMKISLNRAVETINFLTQRAIATARYERNLGLDQADLLRKSTSSWKSALNKAPEQSLN